LRASWRHSRTVQQQYPAAGRSGAVSRPFRVD
jgi:hypothetical protein